MGEWGVVVVGVVVASSSSISSSSSSSTSRALSTHRSGDSALSRFASAASARRNDASRAYPVSRWVYEASSPLASRPSAMALSSSPVDVVPRNPPAYLKGV